MDDLSVQKINNGIAIVTSSEDANESFGNDELMDDIEVKEEEMTVEPIIMLGDQYDTDEDMDHDQPHLFELSEIVESFGSPGHTSTERKRRRRRSTPKWMKDLLQKAQVETVTPDGIKIEYSCTICYTVCRTRTGMRIHIARHHLPEEASINQEILDLVDGSKAADGDVWTCGLCRSNPFKSTNRLAMHQHTMRVHFTMDNQQSSDTSFTQQSPKHAKDRKWIEEMIQQSWDDSSNFYCCCICSALTCGTIRGIRHHIIRVHCEKGEKLAPIAEAPGGTVDRDPGLIQQFLEMSKVPDEDVWNCCICDSLAVKSKRELELHIYAAHCTQEAAESDDDDEAMSDNDDDYRNYSPAKNGKREKEKLCELVDQSKLKDSVGTADTWKCCLCRKLTSKSYKGMKLHIIRKHLKKRRGRKEIPIANVTLKSELNSCDRSNLLKAVNSCKVVVDGAISYKCSVCLQELKSYMGMRYHFMSRHFHDLGELKKFKKLQRTESTSVKIRELSDDDNEWLKECVRKSKVREGPADCYKCWMCREDFNSYCKIKYHVRRIHLHHYKRSTGEFQQHVEDCKLKVGDLGQNSDGSIQELNGSIQEPDSSLQDPNSSIQDPNDTTDEKIWMRANIKKSKHADRSSQNTILCYKCWICDEKFIAYHKIRYHLLITHMPSWKLGPEAFSSHVEQFKQKKDKPAAEAATSHQNLTNKDDEVGDSFLQMFKVKQEAVEAN